MAHGSSADFAPNSPESRRYHGDYGSLVRELDEHWAPPGDTEQARDAFLLTFAKEKMVEHPGKRIEEIVNELTQRAAAGGHTIEESQSEIPAGYTYFGQFVAHDITREPTPPSTRPRDPDELQNLRTPRLDLDCVYGRDPDITPCIYDQMERNAESREGKGKMLIGTVADPPHHLRDLPRDANGRAIVGDSRNDSNAIVSQVHLAFLLAHNALVDRARAVGISDDKAFDAARRSLTRLYQYVVWNDFIKRVTDEKIHQCALKSPRDGSVKWELGLNDVYSWKSRPYIPVEFSVAAYRFGHSMIQTAYRMNDLRGTRDFIPLFNVTDGISGGDLRGHRRLSQRDVIQWGWFLKMSSLDTGRFPQRARKICTKLANSLTILPADVTVSPNKVVAYLDMVRCWRYGLPSGTNLAKLLANRFASGPLAFDPVQLDGGQPDALWFYILREAEQGGGNKLGPLGSTIVCATFAALLKADRDSYFNVEPTWTPDQDALLRGGEYNRDGDRLNGERAWTLASIIRISGLPVKGQDVDDQRVGKFWDT
jgi:Animal haem peroxidase